MSCEARGFPSEIDRLFVGDLPARRREPLREHLAGCASCRGYYARLSAVQRRLAPSEPLGSALLGSDDLIARFAGAPRRRRWWGWIAGAATVGALAIVLLMVRRPALQERGGSPPAHHRGVRAFCLAHTAVVDSASLVPPPATATLRCARSEALQFAYHTDDARRPYLFLVGIGPDGRALHYAPHSDEPASLAMQIGPREVVLPDSTLLAPNHPAGVTEVLALFSDRPLSLAQVDAAIARGGAAAARTLAGESHSLRLEVVP